MAAKISCIIPTFNRGSVLCDTVRMLLDQTYKAHEIIVVDQTVRHDPETQAVLERWAGERAINLIREARPNASRARNIGACAATGDILVFLDDDILIQPDFLQVYADAFSSPNVQGVAGQILEGKAEVVTDLSERQRHRQIDWLYFPKNYAKRCTTGWIASGNFAVRRDRFFEVGGMDCNYRRGAFREESDFAMRFRENGGDFLFEPKASIYHLGMDGAPQGGSRNWIQNKRIAGWHHCVGDWYFTVKFINIRNWRDVFVASLRHFIFNRYNLTHPWLLPWLVVRWLIALPAAVYLRWRGPRLLGGNSL